MNILTILIVCILFHFPVIIPIKDLESAECEGQSGWKSDNEKNVLVI